MQTLQLEGEMENKGVCRPRETMVCREGCIHWGRRQRPRTGRRCSGTGARCHVRPRARAADDLSAEGSGLRARQTKGGPHAPEIPTPTPAVNLRFNIEGLTKGHEAVGGLFVGEVYERRTSKRTLTIYKQHASIQNRLQLKMIMQ